MTYESAPKGAQESATTDLSLSDVPAVMRDQLTRIERILDNILRNLAPMVGAL